MRKDGCSETGFPCKERLEALHRKYLTLAELRRRRDAVEAAGGEWTEGEGVERRAAFRRLAEEFPGALRELELPAALLAARAAEVAEAIAGGPLRVWVRLVSAFHERLGEILRAKVWLARRVGRRGEISADVLAELAEHVGRAVGIEEAEELLHPPEGRLMEIVWRELEAREGLSRETLREMIFSR